MTPQLRVRREQCDTCIFRANSPFDLAKLLAECGPAHGTYAKWRACHSHADGDTVCAGFAERHGADCEPIQLASRLASAGLGAVVLVD